MSATTSALLVRATALHEAATHLAADHPVAAAALRGLAVSADREANTAARAEAAAVALALPAIDTRGRWVRRAQGNTGPGIPGLGHVTVVDQRGTLRAAVTLCGKRLVGDLGWAGRATIAHKPGGWRGCRHCLAMLDDILTSAEAPHVREPA